MRFKDLFTVGFLPSGERGSICDVEGVRVGHLTKIEGVDVRTGVTVVDPGAKNLYRNKLPAAVYVGNGYGKLAGSTQVEELGTLEAPIALTNTLAVGPVLRGVVDVVIKNTPDLKPTETINVVVGETNDGILNTIHTNTITSADTEAAYRACSTNVAGGNVGAGTGTRAFSWKGGIGGASRVVMIGGKKYTIGILIQTNFGGSLTILGVPIGTLLGKNDFADILPLPDGSCMIVVATDAPFSARQLKRLAKRAFLGLIRTGSIVAPGSGDYVIAFSTNRAGVEGSEAGACLPDSDLTPFFLGAVEAAEEAVYDALFCAETLSGRGNTLEALPFTRVVDLLKKYLVNPPGRR